MSTCNILSLIAAASLAGENSLAYRRHHLLQHYGPRSLPSLRPAHGRSIHAGGPEHEESFARHQDVRRAADCGEAQRCQCLGQGT